MQVLVLFGPWKTHFFPLFGPWKCNFSAVSSRRALADVSVVHSTPLNQDILLKNAKKPGAAAMLREQQRNAKYLKASRQVAHNFVPLIFESYGRMGKYTKEFMKNIAKDCIKKQLSREDSQLTAQLLNRWWIKLSCSLQKGISNLILSRSFSILQSKNVSSKNKISIGMLRNLVWCFISQKKKIRSRIKN